MKHQANFSKKNKGSSPFLNSGKHPSRQGFTSKTSSRGIKQRLNKEDSYDEPSLLPQDYIHLINNRQVINDVHCYIDDSIEHTSYYRNLIHYLNEMTELDKLTIWIDSPGGSLDSALAIINAMKNTEGNVLVVISGDCSSAASLC
jgi:ATP-dependent protease ClpP protease subunit